MKVNHGRKSRVGVAWGGVSVTPLSPKNKFAQTRKKVENFIIISVFSNCSNKVGVEHEPEYQGEGVGEGVHAP